jgi:ribonuclease HII
MWIMSKFAKMTVGEINRYLSEGGPTTEEIEGLAKDSRTGARHLAERYLARREAERRERERLHAMLSYERVARENGYTYIAGVDEAGRGPLAGPVMAAAVILPEHFYLPGINDSKKLTPKKREEFYAEIIQHALAWGIGIGDVGEIDQYNILNAAKLAMVRAVLALSIEPDFVLVDALELEGLPVPQLGVIRGDSLSQSIAAASILAKVTRDRWMCEMDKVFPHYGFAEHKGYPTTEHRRAIATFGACDMHRKSFVLLREEDQ